MSREFKKFDQPLVKPYTCLRCGTGRHDDRDYYRLGRFIDDYGELYMCGKCMDELYSFLLKEKGPPPVAYKIPKEVKDAVNDLNRSVGSLLAVVESSESDSSKAS